MGRWCWEVTELMDGRRASKLADVTIGLAVLALLSFAPVAWVIANRQPVEPNYDKELAASAGPSARVSDLPAGLPADFDPADGSSLEKLARDALGPRSAADLLLLLAKDGYELSKSAVGGSLGHAPYPYRYPAMTNLLSRSTDGGRNAQAVALGAALVRLAAVQDKQQGEPLYPNAGPAAYAVLDRIRAVGGCDVQLDLLLLVASDDQPRDEVTREEAARSVEACPSDPTPMWVLGQYQSQRAKTIGLSDLGGDPVPADGFRRASQTADWLLRRYPGSGDVWSMAADTNLREGQRLDRTQPFTARSLFQTAAAQYRRALTLRRSPEFEAGLGAALLGLREPAAAATTILKGIKEKETLGYPFEVFRVAHEAARRPGYRLELLTAAQEAAKDFGDAESTARRLEVLGPKGYPSGPSLFPQSVGTFEGDELQLPMVSMGIDHMAPLSVSLQPPPGGAGGSVEDASFIPMFRSDHPYVGSMPDCPSWGWRRDAMLAGHADAALRDFPAEEEFSSLFRSTRPDRRGDQCGLVIGLADARTLFRVADGQAVPLKGDKAELIYDRLQNMWRWAGDLRRAAAVAKAWSKAAGDAASLPIIRLAEIQYLQGRWEESASNFGLAARRLRQALWNEDLGVNEALLGRGAALLKAGRTDEGMQTLRSVDSEGTQGVAYHSSPETEYVYGVRLGFAKLAYHARSLMADSDREKGNLNAAIENYQAAREMVPILEDEFASGARPERIDANEALARLGTGQPEEAKTAIERALVADPMNPAFLMTAGFVAERLGQPSAAINYNSETLSADPGAFPAANDLGVILERQGKHQAAAMAFRRAVGARPDYALGWFNLGVATSKLGPHHLYTSEGAFAHATRIDSAFGERERIVTLDAKIYRTGLDLSQPLPKRWSFASLERYSPVGPAALAAAVALAIAVARGAGRRGVELAEQFLELIQASLRKVPGLDGLRSPIWAFGATVLALALPLVVYANDQVPMLATLMGIVIILLAAIRVRVLVARRRAVDLNQETWLPGVALGVASGAAGVPFAPLPVINGTDIAPRVHAAAPVTLAALAGVLLLEAAWLEVPLVRSWGLAALVMAASALVPIAPLDGARLGKVGLVVGLGVAGSAVLVAMRLA